MFHAIPPPPTRIISGPKQIPEDQILAIVEEHVREYHRPLSITTNELTGSIMTKLVSALKGEKPDLTIPQPEEKKEKKRQDEIQGDVMEVEYGTEIEGETENEVERDYEYPDAPLTKKDKEKRKRDKKERRKEEKRRKLEERANND